jgi:hypothetical protein
MRSRTILAVFALYLSMHGIRGAQSAPPVPLTFEEEFQNYLKQVYSPSSVLIRPGNRLQIAGF